MATATAVQPLQGPRLGFARAAFGVGVGLTIVTGLAALPDWVDRAMESARRLAERGDGVPYQAVAMAVIGLGLSATVLFLGLAWLIYRARSREILGLVVAYNGVFFGFAVIGPWLVAPASGLDQALTHVVTSIAFVTIFWATLVFPDGRFVPRWAQWLLVVFGTWQIVRAIRPELGAERLGGPWFLLWTMFIVAGIVVQLYRYRAVATPEQRIQQKWWLFGGSLYGLVAVASTPALYTFGFIGSAEPTFWFAGIAPSSFSFAVASSIAFYAASAIFGLCVAVAILRYAALDIDVVISRTLAYTVSTSLLVGAFVGLAILASRLLTPSSGLGMELTLTLAVASALAITFLPLRRFIESVADRVVAPHADLTLLFIDIVGSTARLAELGDRSWADALSRFQAVVRRELVQRAGQEIDAAGDEFFATFATAAAAVASACAMRGAVSAIGFDVRIGIHTGQCELRGRKPIGASVHVAARLMRLAGPGEVLISAPVRDALDDGSFALRDVGRHSLRGIPGEWQVIAVDCRS